MALLFLCYKRVGNYYLFYLSLPNQILLAFKTTQKKGIINNEYEDTEKGDNDLMFICNAFNCAAGVQETLTANLKGCCSGANFCCQFRDSGSVDILKLFHLNKSSPSPKTSFAIFLIRDKVTKCYLLTKKGIKIG